MANASPCARAGAGSEGVQVAVGLRQFPQQAGTRTAQDHVNTYAFQLMTEPLSDEMIHRISPIRGAYSDIRPVIDYYRVTNENRCCSVPPRPFVEHIPLDLKAWNRNLMLKSFPYLKDVKIDLAWGSPMAMPGPISSRRSAPSAVVPTPSCAGLRRLRGDAQPHHLQGTGRGA